MHRSVDGVKYGNQIITPSLSTDELTGIGILANGRLGIESAQEYN
jgi:hypothetical protein